MISQLNNRRSFEHPRLVNDELTMFEGIDVTLDQQQVRATLDR